MTNKYRIFDIKENEYCEEPDYRWLLSRNGKLYNSEKDEWHNIGDRYIVEFSIGEFDIKNIELFEGDVVSYTSKDLDPTPAIIIYSATSFSTKCTVSGELGDIYNFKLKKIGNIHTLNN